MADWNAILLRDEITALRREQSDLFSKAAIVNSCGCDTSNPGIFAVSCSAVHNVSASDMAAGLIVNVSVIEAPLV
jgi:hypothetical protein